MSRRDEERIQDILVRCRRLAEIASKGRRAYDEEWLVSDTANYNLSVLGEALDGLSDEFAARNPGLPIHEAKSLRNKLLHEYWKADADIVWDTITDDLPSLQSALEAVSVKPPVHEPRTKLEPIVQELGSSTSGAICGARNKTGGR